MARARNIKPGFFINEDLVELPFSTRLLFIGLWTIADREGRLDDRPRKIKMAVFPADDIDVEPGLQELHDARMIIRYRTEGKAFIEIINFTKHQSPHVKEPASTIPAPGKSGASTVLATLNDERGMMKDEPLTPENGNGTGLGLTASESGPEYLSGRPRGLRGVPATPEAEVLDTWLVAIAKAVGAQSPQTMASAKGWSEATIAVIREGGTLDKWLEVIQIERDRNRDTPQFFTPNGCLKIFQNAEVKPKIKKFYH